MRKKLYYMIEPNDIGNKLSNIYDFFMIATIIISIIPLAFKETNIVFKYIDYITIGVFIIDYFLRLITADFKLEKSVASFFIYPITPMAIIDLLSILPSLTVLNNGFRLLKLFRLLRTLKVLRAFKFLRYSKSFDIITNVFKKQKKVLSAVATMAIAYVLISALVIYNVEPESFKTFFDAIYWATISLTTVGYGDIYPITTIGRIVTMISSTFGIAIIALPSGVITAGYLAEINKDE
ncbi:MAG: potassium channel family protein [Acutalibacteraceae bacterium]|nr:potassium channel family protein [Acutalibacteraceae bacterium]